MGKIQDKRLKRINPYCAILDNDPDIAVRFCADDRIIIETQGIDELLSLLLTQDTVRKIAGKHPDFFGDISNPQILEIVLTPDFHKGKGVPVGTALFSKGFVLPQVIGNDVNCGMRLMTTSLRKDQILSRIDLIGKKLRHIFFEGGRHLPMTPSQRQALLQYGIAGLVETCRESGGNGLWQYFDEKEESENLSRIHGKGSYPADGIFALDDYTDKARSFSCDSITGTLGGGNHFAEIQYVKRIFDSSAAYAWGLSEGQVVVMIHSGSLGIGHVTGQYFLDLMRRIYPVDIPFPANGIFVLPVSGRHSEVFRKFRTSMRNAANFAFGNRLFLALMVKNALEISGCETGMKVIYDAPHNLIWEDVIDGDSGYLHRKGATPAYGYDGMENTEYAFYGEPVIVPGSMGASSYLLRGQGSREFLCSASHGAGRQLSRGSALDISDKRLDEFLASFHIVTPVDLNRPDIKQRPDIIRAVRDAIKQEAPFAYKEITPVMETLKGAGVASPVAEFYPLMTVKG